MQAVEDGKLKKEAVPKVHLHASQDKALEVVSYKQLKQYAAEPEAVSQQGRQESHHDPASNRGGIAKESSEIGTAQPSLAPGKSLYTCWGHLLTFCLLTRRLWISLEVDRHKELVGRTTWLEKRTGTRRDVYKEAWNIHKFCKLSHLLQLKPGTCYPNHTRKLPPTQQGPVGVALVILVTWDIQIARWSY